VTDKTIDFEELIHKSWGKAVKQEASSNKSLGQIHKDMSNAWIDCLGKGFQEYYSHEDVRVFCRKNKEKNKDKSDFGLSELLFDISVCQIGYVPSMVKKTPLPYIQKCFWQVESEFNNKNSREITKDFSKLVMGRSESQLFVSTYQGDRQKRVLSMCSKIASCCNGNLYMCFVDHPREWSKSPKSPKLFKWEGNYWIPFSSGTRP